MNATCTFYPVGSAAANAALAANTSSAASDQITTTSTGAIAAATGVGQANAASQKLCFAMNPTQQLCVVVTPLSAIPSAAQTADQINTQGILGNLANSLVRQGAQALGASASLTNTLGNLAQQAGNLGGKAAGNALNIQGL